MQPDRVRGEGGPCIALIRRLAGRQPRTASLQFLKTPEGYPYCGNGTYTSADGLVAGLPAFPCRYLDTFDSVYPAVESSALFLSTRINDTLQAITDPACVNLTEPFCGYDQLAMATYFVPATELTTLLIDHTMSVPSLNFSRSSLDMTGYILDGKGNQLDPCTPYYERKLPCPNAMGNFSFAVELGQDGEPDIVAVDTFLEAAGVQNLDDIAGSVQKFGSETYRYAGIMFVVTINYDNYWSYDEDAVRYIYTVTQIPNSDFKAEEVVRLPSTGLPRRQIIDRHGVRIVVSQGGKIGRFNLATLLVNLGPFTCGHGSGWILESCMPLIPGHCILAVTSLGLLAVSTQVVNFMAMNVLQMKHIYRQYQTVTSVDFSDISHMKRSDLNRFRAEDLINPRPAIFESVGKDSGGGVTSGEGQPRQVQAASARPVAQRGYFASIAARAGAKSPTDAADEDAAASDEYRYDDAASDYRRTSGVGVESVVNPLESVAAAAATTDGSVNKRSALTPG